jgi:predicted dehydrogenase
LEKRFGSSLRILGLIDPDTSRSKAQVALKQQAGISGYDACRYWTTPEEASEALGSSLPISLIINGCPPHFRGGTTPSTNLDLRLLTAFPKCKRWLIEKPVSAADPAVELGLGTVLDAYKQSGAIVGVGYMMRALKAVEMIRKIIAEENLTITGTQARYYMAYGHAAKQAWWNKHKSCGRGPRRLS